MLNHRSSRLVKGVIWPRENIRPQYAGRLIPLVEEVIHSAEEPSRGTLRRLREDMTDALLRAGFRFDPGDPARRHSANESRYTIYRLPYEPLSRGQGPLRPEIQIEAAVWPVENETFATAKGVDCSIKNSQGYVGLWRIPETAE